MNKNKAAEVTQTRFSQLWVKFYSTPLKTTYNHYRNYYEKIGITARAGDMRSTPTIRFLKMSSKSLYHTSNSYTINAKIRSNHTKL